MDNQAARADWAERRGLALTASSADPYAVGRKLVRLLDSDYRARFRTATARLDPVIVAVEAAAAVSELAYPVRADRPSWFIR